MRWDWYTKFRKWSKQRMKLVGELEKEGVRWQARLRPREGG